MAETPPGQPEELKNESPKSPEQPRFSSAVTGVVDSVRNGVAAVMAGLGAAGTWAWGKLSKLWGGGETAESSDKGNSSSSGSSEAVSKPASEKEKSAEGPTTFTGTYKQWTGKMDKDKYNFFNRDEEGKKAFYEVIMGPDHGNPIFVVEPDRALTLPSGLQFVDAVGNNTVPDEKIGGILCKAPDAKHRFSFSNPKAPKFTFHPDGSLQIEGESERWYLTTLFRKDKNRIVNYDAYFGKKKPSKVRIVELEDLPLYEEQPDELFAAPKLAA